MLAHFGMHEFWTVAAALVCIGLGAFSAMRNRR
jgi:hypothetical protein